MKSRTVKLGGVRYCVRWVARLGKVPHTKHDKAGDCDVQAREIRIVGGLDEHEERRVLIHEALHACLPMLDEEAVDKASEEVNEMLTRCGFPPVQS